MATKKITPLTAATDVITQLRAKGFRITKLRQTLLELLFLSNSPLSVPEILANLKKKRLVVNKTSIYRELEFLLAEDLLGEVDFLDGSKRYERHSHHHHHLVCSQCKHVTCIDACVDLSPFYSRASKLGFIVDKHVLEFFGRCSRCQRL